MMYQTIDLDQYGNDRFAEKASTFKYRTTVKTGKTTRRITVTHRQMWRQSYGGWGSSKDEKQSPGIWYPKLADWRALEAMYVRHDRHLHKAWDYKISLIKELFELQGDRDRQILLERPKKNHGCHILRWDDQYDSYCMSYGSKDDYDPQHCDPNWEFVNHKLSKEILRLDRVVHSRRRRAGIVWNAFSEAIQKRFQSYLDVKFETVKGGSMRHHLRYEGNYVFAVENEGRSYGFQVVRCGIQQLWGYRDEPALFLDSKSV